MALILDCFSTLREEIEKMDALKALTVSDSSLSLSQILFTREVVEMKTRQVIRFFFVNIGFGLCVVKLYWVAKCSREVN